MINFNVIADLYFSKFIRCFFFVTGNKIALLLRCLCLKVF